MYTSGSASTNRSNTAKNFEAAINANSSQCAVSPCFGTGTTANASATATVLSTTVTLTAKTGGFAGAFTTAYGSSDIIEGYLIAITQTVIAGGPGYVSGITISAGGSGYQPETPITLTDDGAAAQLP